MAVWEAYPECDSIVRRGAGTYEAPLPTNSRDSVIPGGTGAPTVRPHRTRHLPTKWPTDRSSLSRTGSPSRGAGRFVQETARKDFQLAPVLHDGRRSASDSTESFAVRTRRAELGRREGTPPLIRPTGSTRTIRRFATIMPKRMDALPEGPDLCLQIERSAGHPGKVGVEFSDHRLLDGAEAPGWG